MLSVHSLFLLKIGCTLVNFFSLFLFRGRRWSNCYLNRPSIKQLYATTWERSTRGEMVTLRNMQWEGCPLLCLKENALVCLVPMVLGRLLLSIWLVKFDLSARNVFWKLPYFSFPIPSFPFKYNLNLKNLFSLSRGKYNFKSTLKRVSLSMKIANFLMLRDLSLDIKVYMYLIVFLWNPVTMPRVHFFSVCLLLNWPAWIAYRWLVSRSQPLVQHLFKVLT